MIEYSTEKSSFLDRNKLYCQDVQSKLATLNYDCSGNCNAYGYNLLSQFERNRLKFRVKFTKYQRTGAGTNNSWWLPSSNIKINVYEYIGYEFKVNGFNKKIKLIIAESWIRRIFQSKELNDVLPPPYYIKSNSELKTQFILSVLSIVKKHSMDEFKLSGGELICRIHRPDCDFIRLISDIEVISKE